jgi:hypothetical protein
MIQPALHYHHADHARHATPGLRAVLAAQIRAIGFMLRRPVIVGGVLLALAMLLITVELRGTGKMVNFHPEQYVLPGLLGLLLPLAVWKGEDRFAAAFLWTLPVERRSHVLLKVLAGWVWLMAAVALAVLWILALALFSGGTVLGEELRQTLPAYSREFTGPFDPSAVQQVWWTPRPLLWLVPFTAATVTYLLASAIAVGLRQPLRWIAGGVFGFFLLVAIAETADAARVIEGADRVLDALLNGRYGIHALLTARTESLQVAATLTTGERLVVWRAFPDPGEWVVATLFWTGGSLAALWAAASRHRERRHV